MPLEIGVWRVDSKLERMSFSHFPSEEKLEELLVEDAAILDPSLMIIGRQVGTSYGKLIDLLAINSDGHLVVIELKRNKTPREVVAQLLDYGTWIRTLKAENIADIYNTFIKKYGNSSHGQSLDEAFCGYFGLKSMPEELNERHELLIVASELDDSTERIVEYLADEYGVAINVAFFRFFKDDGREYLSRAWLVDPIRVEALEEEKRGEESWNGEYYVSFGQCDHRRWDDARRYGYISAGGGSWYTKTLNLLTPQGRIWVNVPGEGYVGVGVVQDAPKPIKEFTVKDGNGKEVPITSTVEHLPDPKCPPEEFEYFVPVKWIKTVPLEQAVRETGFFGNQNSAAKPKTKKWNHTITRLKEKWNIHE